MIISWTSENNLIIIGISSALYNRWCADDLLMIFQGSSTDRFHAIIWWSCDYHVIIMWLSCDYHMLIIYCSSNDHLMICYRSSQKDLSIIQRLSAVYYHMIMLWSGDYCVKWSHNGNLLGRCQDAMVWYLEDVEMVWFLCSGNVSIIWS